jgi:hypothetical protein
MSLTKNDLLKMGIMMKSQLNDFREQMEEMIENKIFPLREDLNLLKDDMAGIKTTLNTELPLIYQRLNSISRNLDNHEIRVGSLEAKAYKK